MAMPDDELHAARLGYDLLHLGKVYEESSMTTDNHWVTMKVIFHLFGGGAKHVGAHLTIA